MKEISEIIVLIKIPQLLNTDALFPHLNTSIVEFPSSRKTILLVFDKKQEERRKKLKDKVDRIRCTAVVCHDINLVRR